MKKKKPNPSPDSFTGSDKHVLDGVKLEPWTPARIIAGQAMGILYPRIGKEGWDQYKRTKTYPGVLKDIIICLYLCTLTVDEVDEADAMPVEAYRRAREWAGKLGLHQIDSAPFWQAFEKFIDIMAEVGKSTTIPSNSGEEPDEGNE